MQLTSSRLQLWIHGCTFNHHSSPLRVNNLSLSQIDMGSLLLQWEIACFWDWPLWDPIYPWSKHRVFIADQNLGMVSIRNRSFLLLGYLFLQFLEVIVIDLFSEQARIFSSHLSRQKIFLVRIRELLGPIFQGSQTQLCLIWKGILQGHHVSFRCSWSTFLT